MSSVRMILFSLVLLLGGLLDTEAISVKGIVGGNVVIQCSHANAQSNIKYFCKDPCDNKDVLIRSRGTGFNKKYSIQDNGNTFTVIIYGLTEEDSGTYFCGIERFVKDTFSRVDLTVKPRELEPTPEANTPEPDVTLPQSTPDVSSPNTPEPDDDDDDDDDNGEASTKDFPSQMLVYIGASLGVILLLLAMVLLIYYRRRKRDQASPGKSPVVIYESHDREEPNYVNSQNIQQHASSDNIYFNVSVSSPDVFYSTVSFNKHNNQDGGGDGVSRGATEVEYASVKPKGPKPEPKVYQVRSGF